MGWKDTFEVVTKKTLDNPLVSAKVAQRLEKRNSIVEIVPNTFGGVNTHFWCNQAYIVGIVPVVRSAYSSANKEMDRIRRGDACLLGQDNSKENMACYPTENSETSNEAEDRDTFHTEEARSGTDRVGMANNR